MEMDTYRTISLSTSDFASQERYRQTTSEDDAAQAATPSTGTQHGETIAWMMPGDLGD